MDFARKQLEKYGWSEGMMLASLHVKFLITTSLLSYVNGHAYGGHSI